MPLSGTMGTMNEHVQHQLGVLNLPLCTSLTDLASDPRDRHKSGSLPRNSSDPELVLNALTDNVLNACLATSSTRPVEGWSCNPNSIR